MAPKMVIPTEIMLKILKRIIFYDFILTKDETTSTAQGLLNLLTVVQMVVITHSLV